MISDLPPCFMSPVTLAGPAVSCPVTGQDVEAVPFPCRPSMELRASSLEGSRIAGPVGQVSQESGAVSVSMIAFKQVQARVQGSKALPDGAGNRGQLWD